MTLKSILFISAALIVLSSMLAIGIVTYVRGTHNENSNVNFDAQPCRFEEFAGTLTVEEIRPNSSENAEKEKLIIYQFDPGNVTGLPYVKKDGGQIETTAAEIKRLGIKPGKQFQTKAEYIISGFCRAGPQ